MAKRTHDGAAHASNDPNWKPGMIVKLDIPGPTYQVGAIIHNVCAHCSIISKQYALHSFHINGAGRYYEKLLLYCSGCHYKNKAIPMGEYS